MPRLCVPRRVLDLFGDPFLAERESDFLNAVNATFMSLRDRPEIVRGRRLAGSLASMSFFSSRTRRGERPRILAVSSAVGNRELIRTPITPLYTRILAPSQMFRFPVTSPPASSSCLHSSSSSFLNSLKNLTGFPSRSFRQIRKSESISLASSARIMAVTSFP